MTNLKEQLRAFPVFQDLPEALLDWLETHATLRTLERGEQLFEPGAPADTMYIVLEGMVHFERRLGGQFLGTLTLRPGNISGLLPYSRMTHAQGRGFALQPTRMLTVNRSQFPEMLACSEEFGRRLVGIMSDRVREVTRTDEQREKLAALGTLAAGIAHELNNPAAAVRRAATTLQERIEQLPELTGRLIARGVGPRHFSAMCTARAGALERPRGDTLPALHRGRAEQAMAAWLEQRGVSEAWILAETYVDAGLSVEDLERMAAGLPPAATGDALAWVETMTAVQRLVQDIGAASGRISDLIGAVKAYSHLDRAQDRQATDLHAGLESTLIMLGHKIKRRSATIERVFAGDLPPVPVNPGEINQVWTNLLDNALDAIPDGGTIRIETVREGSFACVKIADNGRGIPQELRSRIFEPFFTTKPVGEGTGLGLDIAQRIVVQHHGGEIGVESRPGETVFTVCLPLEAAEPLPLHAEAG